MIGLILFVLIALAACAWWWLVKGREQARLAAGVVCREHGLVLMDDTVVLDSVRLRRRSSPGGIGLQYRFDFARNGILNRGGSVLIRPRHPATVVISTADGRLIESVAVW